MCTVKLVHVCYNCTSPSQAAREKRKFSVAGGILRARSVSSDSESCPSSPAVAKDLRLFSSSLVLLATSCAKAQHSVHQLLCGQWNGFKTQHSQTYRHTQTPHNPPRTCTYSYTHTHTLIHTRKHTHTYSFTFANKHIHTHTNAHTLIHTHTHTLIHPHTHTRTHTYSFTLTHTHTHRQVHTYIAAFIKLNKPIVPVTHMTVWRGKKVDCMAENTGVMRRGKKGDWKVGSTRKFWEGVKMVTGKLEAPECSEKG